MAKIYKTISLVDKWLMGKATNFPETSDIIQRCEQNPAA